nr:MAG TPA: hypothetical protein [Caudoviricetes sp.]DAY52853.1 MAG TPA: hypothetical protein [Caudoviricetes sp.]
MSHKSLPGARGGGAAYAVTEGLTVNPPVSLRSTAHFTQGGHGGVRAPRPTADHR